MTELEDNNLNQSGRVLSYFRALHSMEPRQAAVAFERHVNRARVLTNAQDQLA